jgi:hypothetical protein
MTTDRLLLVFKMCCLAIEMPRPGKDAADEAAVFGSRYGVTVDEAREVLAMRLQDVAAMLWG